MGAPLLGNAQVAVVPLGHRPLRFCCCELGGHRLQEWPAMAAGRAKAALATQHGGLEASAKHNTAGLGRHCILLPAVTSTTSAELRPFRHFNREPRVLLTSVPAQCSQAVCSWLGSSPLCHRGAAGREVATGLGAGGATSWAGGFGFGTGCLSLGGKLLGFKASIRMRGSDFPWCPAGCRLGMLCPLP